MCAVAKLTLALGSSACKAIRSKSLQFWLFFQLWYFMFE